MAEAREVFEAIIKARDETGAALENVHVKFAHLEKDAERVGIATEHMHKPHVFAAINEHVDLVLDHFGELRASVSEVGTSMTELLPALGAIAIAGGLERLFETAEHVSESYALLAHSATSLGMTTEQLQQLRAAAILTDTNVESMEKSLSKLNRVLADTASGHNKDVAKTFARLGIDLRDSNHHLRAAGDILPDVADAFAHTRDAVNRTRAAFALFGKTGADLIPMLSKGGDYVRERMKEGGELALDFTPYAEGLEAYNESMKKLGLATHSFTDEVGAKLAPVLRPVVDTFTTWVKANQDWMTSGITGGVSEFAKWLEKIDWKRVGKETEDWAHSTHELVHELGGLSTIGKVLGAALAFKTGKFLLGPALEVAALTRSVIGLGMHLTELSAKWASVGTAAAAAAQQERAAATLAVGGSLGTGADRIRAQALASEATGGRPSPQTSASIAGRGLALLTSGGLLAFEASQQASQGLNLDKDFVRNVPGLANFLTKADFDKLPEGHRDPGFLGALFGMTDDPEHPGWIERQERRFFGPSTDVAVQDRSLPLKVETTINTNLRVEGLPPGAFVTVDSTTSGHAANTRVMGAAGRAWADRYG